MTRNRTTAKMWVVTYDSGRRDTITGDTKQDAIEHAERHTRERVSSIKNVAELIDNAKQQFDE